MSVKLLTEHRLEFLTLKGGCAGLSESTHVNMPHIGKNMPWLSYLLKKERGLPVTLCALLVALMVKDIFKMSRIKCM